MNAAERVEMMRADNIATRMALVALVKSAPDDRKAEVLACVQRRIRGLKRRGELSSSARMRDEITEEEHLAYIRGCRAVALRIHEDPVWPESPFAAGCITAPAKVAPWGGQA